MKLQRRFAPTGGEFTPESVARFIGIRITQGEVFFQRKDALDSKSSGEKIIVFS